MPTLYRPPIYLIWCNSSPNAPTIPHKTSSEAEREAERLAAKHPGKEFIILKSIASCVSKNVQWEAHA